MPRTSRKLPTEWAKYSPLGDLIAGTRLFAFKTPLSLQLQQRAMPKSHRFSTADLFWKMAEAGRSVGLVVNVTNTGRYYDRADIEGMMVGYKEVRCPGKGFLDRKDVVKAFIRAVDDFLLENQGNDLLIGVHCSNGVNRAGYLICRYLVDRLGWSSHQAIDAFETARGYAFERGSYVQAIHNADRERRLKQQRQATSSSQQGGAGSGSSELNADGTEQMSEDRSTKANETQEGEGELLAKGGDREERSDAKKKRRKRKKPTADPLADIMPGFDPAFAAQMMQQFFALERQMKETAANAVAATQSSPAVPAPCLPPPAKQGRSSASASPYTGGGDSSSLPMAYSTPNPTSFSPNIAPIPPTNTATQSVNKPAAAGRVGGSAVGPFTGMSLKTKTLAQTANFAFTTQKLKDTPTSGAAAPSKSQQPAYTPRAAPTGAVRDPLQAAKAAAQSVSIAMELKGAEQISDDDEEEAEEDGEEDDGSGEGREIDFDSMGKIDVREYSASQQRRMRRKKLEKQFQVMKRGKFWEINQMRKEMGK